MNYNVLVCGATGFVGSNLIRKLGDSYKIYALYHKKKPFFLKNVKWVKGDLRDYKQCLKLTKKIDIIIQAAATTSGSKDIINAPYLHVTDNAIMNSYLLKAAFKNKIKHFIFTSCTVMYKNSNKPLKEDEVEEKKIFETYYGVAHTKLYVEKICKFYSKISKTKFTVVRHSNLYGPYDKFDIDKGHFIASSIAKMFKNQTFTMFGKGDEKRDYLYIDDFVRFVKLVIQKQKNNFEIFNCSYGKSFKIKDVLKKINLIFNKNKKIRQKKGKNINVNILVNSDKAKKFLNWGPKINIENGLKKTISWYRKKNEKFL